MTTREIHGHKTAIRRGDFLRPVKCLLRDGLIRNDSTFFDYGCGRGEDVDLLRVQRRDEAAGVPCQLLPAAGNRAATTRVGVAVRGKSGVARRIHGRRYVSRASAGHRGVAASPGRRRTIRFAQAGIRLRPAFHRVGTVGVDCPSPNGRHSGLPGAYATTANPPILHRKETLLCPGHPLFEKFARLTRQEEKQGLLTETARIGTRSGWEARLRETGFVLRGHRLVRGATGREQGAAGHIPHPRPLSPGTMYPWSGRGEQELERKMVERKMNIFLSPIFLIFLPRK